MAAFTDAQTDAINAQGGSVLVSAAAGSGKTTVLIERIIRMVMDILKQAFSQSGMKEIVAESVKGRVAGESLTE